MCTNIGATGSSVKQSGKTYIGSVSDDPYDIRTKVVVRRIQGEFAYIGTHLSPLGESSSAADYSDSVSGAPTRGLNEKGLAFTWTLALEKEENQPCKDAKRPHDVWAEVMGTCATADEALTLLSRLPRNFAGAGMIADKEGSLILVELGRKKLEIRERLDSASGGTGTNVNCWIKMQNSEGDPMVSISNPDVPNQSRFTRSEKLLSDTEGLIDLSEMIRILSDHEHRDRFAGDNPWIPGHGYSICNHGSLHTAEFVSEKPAWGSVSAEVISPMDDIFWYTYGWPCGESPQHGDQLLQERSWGHFIGFKLSDLPAGDYTTLTGELTHLALQQFNRLTLFSGSGDQISAENTSH